MATIITLILAVITFRFVLIPLRTTSIKRYGAVGEVWFYRLLYLSVFSIVASSYDNTMLDTCMLWVFGGLLTINMLIYNPWSIHKVIAYGEAKTKEMLDMKDKDKDNEDLL